MNNLNGLFIFSCFISFYRYTVWQFLKWLIKIPIAVKEQLQQQLIDISKTSVQRILSANKFHPYLPYPTLLAFTISSTAYFKYLLLFFNFYQPYKFRL
jgi:hypothetical protein